MKPIDLDHIRRHFAERRLSQRQALATGGAGIHPTAAQEATPNTVVPEPWDGEKRSYLFVQSFHSGSITPREGEDGRYTVTLEQGTGQTIYFGDHPSRDVGAGPTAAFMEGLGFSEENPPNAAMIVETAPGETDVAVVELFNPTIAPDTGIVTYDVEVLENWRDDLELGLQEDPTDLAALAPEFGAAHLLIDDCPTDVTVYCRKPHAGWYDTIGSFYPVDTCLNFTFWCMPCEPYGFVQPDSCATFYYWADKCNATFPECEGKCWSVPNNYVIQPC